MFYVKWIISQQFSGRGHWLLCPCRDVKPLIFLFLVVFISIWFQFINSIDCTVCSPTMKQPDKKAVRKLGYPKREVDTVSFEKIHESIWLTLSRVLGQLKIIFIKLSFSMKYLKCSHWNLKILRFLYILFSTDRSGGLLCIGIAKGSPKDLAWSKIYWVCF